MGFMILLYKVPHTCVRHSQMTIAKYKLDPFYITYSLDS